MAHRLSPLPFSRTALEPFLSAETIDFHYGKHHKGYVDKLNALIAGTEFEDLSLVETIQKASGRILANAAQVWNHDFYWYSLTPQGTPPHGNCLHAIEKQFKSIDRFYDELHQVAEGLFGSGWAWVVMDKNGEVGVEATSNADNPLMHGRTPLLAIDVWEHAYYIDYRDSRAHYLDAALDILNWNFAEDRFKATLLAAAG